MPRRQVDPEQTKLKRQQRNQRYRANLETTERNRGRNTLYQQKKREQARLAQHPNLLLPLADDATQQTFLQQPFPPCASPQLQDEEDAMIQGIDSFILTEQGADIEEDGEVIVTSGGHMYDENDGGFMETEPVDDMSSNYSSDKSILLLFINTDMRTTNNQTGVSTYE